MNRYLLSCLVCVGLLSATGARAEQTDSSSGDNQDRYGATQLPVPLFTVVDDATRAPAGSVSTALNDSRSGERVQGKRSDDQSFQVMFDICVDEQGRLSCLRPNSSMDDQLLSAVSERAANWEFPVRMRAQQAVAYESRLKVQLKGVRQTDQTWSMHIESAGIEDSDR